MPVTTSTRRQILIRVPEGAVVDRIDAHAAVVAPAVCAHFRTPTLENKRFSFHGSERIGRNPAGVINSGVHAGTGFAVSHGNVANVIHCYAGHPAPVPIGRKCPLLAYQRGCSRILYFIPPYAGRAAYGMCYHKRLVTVLEVPVGKPVHEAVAKRVQGLRGAHLGYADSSTTSLREWRNWNTDGAGES